MRLRLLSLCAVVAVASCKKDKPAEPPAPTAAKTTPTAPQEKKHTIGLVTDVGGRGDQSFNDSALRGLEVWAAAVKYEKGAYVPLADADRAALLPKEFAGSITTLPIKPIVVQSKVQEDYQPNLQLLVDQSAELIIGVGYMLENAIEAVAKTNPSSKFLLVDSPMLDEKGTPYVLPNVQTIVFREEEGSFLVGALAGLVAKDKVAFVGGMEVPLIKRFEMGFRAGVKSTNPKATVLVQYTGSFDNVGQGKQVGQDAVAKGAEVVFHAAGSDGLGVIQAVKEAHAAGKSVFAIGVDSDQSHVAPDVVLTSMVKRVDLAVWRTVKGLGDGTFSGGDRAFGLKEEGVGYADVKLDFPGKAEALAKVEALKKQIIDGSIKVPSNQAELDAFVPAK